MLLHVVPHAMHRLYTEISRGPSMWNKEYRSTRLDALGVLLDLSGVERRAIQIQSRLCSLLCDKRTDKVG
jgi:hypothetical protein